RMSAERAQEFEQLRRYICFFATAVWHIPADASTHPANQLARAPRKATKSQLLAGLRQAARDTAESCEHLSTEQVSAIDEACKEHNVLTLSEVRARYFRRRSASGSL